MDKSLLNDFDKKTNPYNPLNSIVISINFFRIKITLINYYCNICITLLLKIFFNTFLYFLLLLNLNPL